MNLGDLIRRIRKRGGTCAFDDGMGFRFQLEQADRGHTVIRATPHADHVNPFGAVHGGFVAGLADSCVGSCMVSLLARGEACTNMDLDVRFLRRVDPGDDLEATATVLKEGRRISIIDCVVRRGDEPVATARSTFLRIPAPTG